MARDAGNITQILCLVKEWPFDLYGRWKDYLASNYLVSIHVKTRYFIPIFFMYSHPWNTHKQLFVYISMELQKEHMSGKVANSAFFGQFYISPPARNEMTTPL